MSADTRGDTVFRGIAWSAFACSANTACVDVKDGRVLRIRPLHYDEIEGGKERRPWRIKARGKTFEPGEKTLLPPLSLSYKKRVYSKNRILHPMRRVDWDPHGERNTQNRGKSKYVRISWDEATQIIADEIKRVHDEYGPLAILCQADGHGETKVVHAPHGCQAMMFDLVGGYTLQARQPDSWEGWYWGGKHIWGMEPVGMQVNQRNLYKDICEHGDAILYWGCDLETTPWGWGGEQPSRMAYFLEELGVRPFFISPDLNYAGAAHKGKPGAPVKGKWIPVLPNTDAALQLAIAYTWITEGTYYRDYVDTHTVGFDWFERYVLGGEDGVPKTPKWAEGKCGVPSYTIKALARYWAKHAVSIAHADGGGMIRSPFSAEPARLEIVLLAMQGLGRPGTGQLHLIEFGQFGFDEWNPLPRSEKYFEVPGAYHGWMETIGHQAFVPKTMVPQALMLPEGEKLRWYGHVVCTAPREDQFIPFEFPVDGAPMIHMIWSDSPSWTTCWNGGFAMQEALRSKRVETVVMQHPWFENDTLFADVVLPVSTMFEEKDIAVDNWTGQFNLMYVQDDCVDPLGESKSDWECVIEVARKLERFGGAYENLVERYTRGMDVDEWIKAGFDSAQADALMSYEEFAERKICVAPTAEGWEDDPVALAAWYDDPASQPLQTPTRKIEIYATGLAEHFPDDETRPVVPHWIEESEELKERLSCDRAVRYPFLMVTNHPRWRVHSEHDDVTWLREIRTCKVEGPDGYLYEPVWLNPVDAGRLGLVDGDVVRVYNERGSVLGGVYVNERIMPGAVYQDHGARVDPIVGGRGGLDRGGANNLICPEACGSRNTASEATNGFLVNVEKVDVAALAALHPDEFGRAYDPADGLRVSAWMVEDE
ncbi:molybdopterin-dependent oxidoreductase [Gordonibacter pamelaeae]|uniref:molybdopterin-dependent oxidoreductase n=1 Tax=Gordonibacter pamelaeae TaxID=471189 RepID=UPI003AF1B7E4